MKALSCARPEPQLVRREVSKSRSAGTWSMDLEEDAALRGLPRESASAFAGGQGACAHFSGCLADIPPLSPLCSPQACKVSDLSYSPSFLQPWRHGSYLKASSIVPSLLSRVLVSAPLRQWARPTVSSSRKERSLKRPADWQKVKVPLYVSGRILTARNPRLCVRSSYTPYTCTLG